MTKPTVGRIVHFYSEALTRTGPNNGFNAVGAGPYAAMVTQVFEAGFINLKIQPPFAAAFDEGSVSEKGSQFATAVRYWEWPPRE
jgi:hypothetical protein